MGVVGGNGGREKREGGREGVKKIGLGGGCK